ncbi:hypothetical protein ACPYO6_09125 [Georgenia sp. Z1344]|uniref:hypothetical protein n=1 Tax=Georgenia sp. Z1344 TaxID=3416706 RepID=UPI003CE94FFA
MAARTGGRSDTRLIVTMIVSTLVLLAVIIGGTLVLDGARGPSIDDRNLGPRIPTSVVYTDDGAATTYSLTGDWETWDGATTAGAVEGWQGTYSSGSDSVAYGAARFTSQEDVDAFTEQLTSELEAAGATVRSEGETNTDGTGTLRILDTADPNAPVQYLWDNGRGLVFTLAGEDWPVYEMYVAHEL